MQILLDRFKHFDYDLIVIGAGAAGLTASIGGAVLGAKTLLIEKNKIGGDCTHYGCIPSKSLIHLAKEYRDSKSTTEILELVRNKINHIYEHEKPEVLISKYGMDFDQGIAKFINKNTIQINNRELTAKKIIIATGSSPHIPDISGLNTISYLTNQNIFSIDKDFDSLTILGAGYIGCELAQAFSQLGIKVTLISKHSTILPQEDPEALRIIEQSLTKSDVQIIHNEEIQSISESNDQKIIKLNSGKELISDHLLVATGRKPNIKELNLEAAGIEYTNKGININEQTQTTNNRVYAIGDVTVYPHFSHYANHHGKTALVNSLMGLKNKAETVIIPKCIFTTPELASTGYTEERLKANNISYNILKKDFSEVDRAITQSETKGFIKLFVDKRGYILGAVIVGKNAGELINEITLAMKYKISAPQISDTIHAYPTWSYALMQTAGLFRSQNFTKEKKKLLQNIFGFIKKK